MALARSASVPGGLSINTNSANLFGSSSTQPPAAGGLFGSATQPTTTSIFGGNATATPAPATATAATAPSGGLFGQTANATQQPATGGMFGSTAAKPAGGGLFGAPAAGGSAFGGTAAPAGNLFGSTATPAQPAATGGLFGTSAATQQPQQTTGGGLFGTASTTQQPATGVGLFGSTSATQQPATGGGLFGTASTAQQPAAGGLFGQASTATQQPAAGGSIFGATQQQQQPAAGGSLFGGGLGGLQQPKPTLGSSLLGQPAAQQQAGGGMFGQTLNRSTAAAPPGLTMGQANQQQQQVVPGVRIDLSNLKNTTRYNDLQEGIQQEILKLDKGIQAVIRQCGDVEAFMPGHGEQLEALPNDVRFVTRKYEGASDALSEDARAISAVRDLSAVDFEQAKLSFKAVDNLKLPAQYHTAGLWAGAGATRQQQDPAVAAGGAGGVGDGNSDLISFFSKTADEMDEQLQRLRRNLGEIESHMNAVSGNLIEQLQRSAAAKNGGGGGSEDQVAELAEVLRGFEQTILGVATSVGAAREGVTALQLGEFLDNGMAGW